VERIRTEHSPETSKKKLQERTLSNMKATKKGKMDSSSLLPVLGTERRNSTIFSKTRAFRSREISFKKSLDAQIANTYLKTEY
jgi:hypothetical protein